MKNDRITLPDGSTERPIFRRISLNKWEASADVPLCAKPGTSHRMLVATGPTRPAATAKLQTKINEAADAPTTNNQQPTTEAELLEASSSAARATISTPQPAQPRAPWLQGRERWFE